MNKEFLRQTSLIEYSSSNYNAHQLSDLEELVLSDIKPIKWYNTYGISYKSEFRQIIQNNLLDEFVVKLMTEENVSSKVMESEKFVFVNAKVLKTDGEELEFERIMFISSPSYVWSIQEKQGDYFDWIRERIQDGKGIIRRKKADYLLYLLLESIVENYQATYQNFGSFSSDLLDSDSFKATPEFMTRIEKRKQELTNFKRATSGLRDVMIKLEKINVEEMSSNYFSELKEQTNSLITDIDFEMQELQSKVSLIFSIQGHRLNEVMKTLTVISVVFIPLTFLAGIYGMNFKNMPELNTEWGYFILISIMVLIATINVWYFLRKKWF